MIWIHLEKIKIFLNINTNGDVKYLAKTGKLYTKLSLNAQIYNIKCKKHQFLDKSFGNSYKL